MTAIVSREDYFDAALSLLADEGPAGVKVGQLCGSLGVTTGSFYHHFRSMAAFVTELLEHWEQQATTLPLDRLDGNQSARQRIETIMEIAVALPHRAEAAMRAWSHTNTDVAKVLSRVDAARREAVETLLVEVLDSRERAARLALMAMVLLAGFQLTRDATQVGELVGLLEELVAYVESIAVVPL